MAAYYNEIDPSAAQWLRNLIEAGHIAPGHVDERSIEDVTPEDLAGYTQCHFFAGIGVWSYALRRAGWPDDRPIWTGSCPCQPFSSAGTQAGFDDERHLWPHFQWLIEQCRPAIVFGEQVASKAVEPWVDLVQTDLEGLGYAFGCVPFPSAGVGAPHIRDRLFWVGHTDEPGSQGHPGHGSAARWQGSSGSAATAGVSGGLADSTERGRREERADGRRLGEGDRTERLPAGPMPSGAGIGLADPNSEQHDRSRSIGPPGRSQHSDGGANSRLADTDGERRGEARNGSLPGGETERAERDSRDHRPRPTNGFWADADWLFCRDGKWRPVEPGTFPLAYGAPARVVRLRAYGNAINAEAAREFIEAYLDTQDDCSMTR